MEPMVAIETSVQSFATQLQDEAVKNVLARDAINRFAEALGTPVFRRHYPMPSSSLADSASRDLTPDHSTAFEYGTRKASGILGHTVYNENNQKVERLDDLIIAPDSAVSFAIVGAGGFVGIGRHDVAVSVQEIKLQDDGKFILPGATKDATKVLPKFEYAKKK